MHNIKTQLLATKLVWMGYFHIKWYGYGTYPKDEPPCKYWIMSYLKGLQVNYLNELQVNYKWTMIGLQIHGWKFMWMNFIYHVTISNIGVCDTT